MRFLRLLVNYAVSNTRFTCLVFAGERKTGAGSHEHKPITNVPPAGRLINFHNALSSVASIWEHRIVLCTPQCVTLIAVHPLSSWVLPPFLVLGYQWLGDGSQRSAHTVPSVQAAAHLEALLVWRQQHCYAGQHQRRRGAHRRHGEDVMAIAFDGCCTTVIAS